MSEQTANNKEGRPHWDTLQKSQPEITEELREARRALYQSQAREEAFHRLMSREVAERDRIIMKTKRTSAILTALVMLLVLTVAGELAYIKSLQHRIIRTQRAAIEQRDLRQPARAGNLPSGEWRVLPQRQGGGGRSAWSVV